jgi:hypothetical protein
MTRMFQSFRGHPATCEGWGGGYSTARVQIALHMITARRGALSFALGFFRLYRGQLITAHPPVRRRRATQGTGGAAAGAAQQGRGCVQVRGAAARACHLLAVYCACPHLLQAKPSPGC